MKLPDSACLVQNLDACGLNTEDDDLQQSGAIHSNDRRLCRFHLYYPAAMNVRQRRPSPDQRSSAQGEAEGQRQREARPECRALFLSCNFLVSQSLEVSGM